ncbi:MAG: hypothetical protein ABI193_03230, partial [Minicystis sp.]
MNRIVVSPWSGEPRPSPALSSRRSEVSGIDTGPRFFRRAGEGWEDEGFLGGAVDAQSLARYVGADGQVDASVIFDHLLEVSRELDPYSRLADGEGRPLS